MSRDCVSLVKTKLSIEELVLCIGQVVGSNFVRNVSVSWDLFEATPMGLFVSVYKNDGFENTDEIDFSPYEYAVDIGPNSRNIPVEMKGEWPRLFSRALMHLLPKDKIERFLVTDDVQAFIEDHSN